MVLGLFIAFGMLFMIQPLFIGMNPPRNVGLDSPLGRQRFAEFYCYKLRTCTPGGPPVCGFDDYQRFLAQFEDLCTLYKINCERKGLFTLVEENICEGQKRFEADAKIYDIPKDFFTSEKNIMNVM